MSVLINWEASKQVRKYILNASHMHAPVHPPKIKNFINYNHACFTNRDENSVSPDQLGS